MSTIDRLVNRLTERTRRDVAAVAADACPACTPEQRLGLALLPGDAVIDLVTGQKGIIRAGQRETYLVTVPPTER